MHVRTRMCVHVRTRARYQTVTHTHTHLPLAVALVRARAPTRAAPRRARALLHVRVLLLQRAHPTGAEIHCHLLLDSCVATQ